MRRSTACPNGQSVAGGLARRPLFSAEDLAGVAGNSRRALALCRDDRGWQTATGRLHDLILTVRRADRPACGLGSSGCLGSPGQGLVVEPCCPGILWATIASCQS